MIGEPFQIHDDKINTLENTFTSQKIVSKHFYSCTLRQNSPPRSYHHPQFKGFLENLFPQQKGGETVWHTKFAYTSKLTF